MTQDTTEHWQIDEYGLAPDELRRVESTIGPPQTGELRLEMLASPVNPADLNLIQGNYGVRPDLPFTPGLEGVARVLDSRAEGYESGDEVILFSGIGTWARQLNVPAGETLKIPAGIDPLQSAMLKVNPQTANRILSDYVDLKEGDWVVQNAANSGVGRCLIQLARERGIRTLNLVRREELKPELKALGADEVILDTREAVKAWSEANPGIAPRLASNSVGGDSALRLMNLLGKGGTLVTFGAMSRQPLKVPNGLLIFKDLKLRGHWVSEWIRQASPPQLEQSYDELARLMADGKLSQAVDSVHAFDELPAALERAQAEGRDGKVLIRF